MERGPYSHPTGLPQQGTPPPPTLSMPSLGIPSGEISIAIVTIDQNCPVSPLSTVLDASFSHEPSIS